MIAPVSSSTSPLGLAPIGTLVRPAAPQAPPANSDLFSPSTIVSLGNRPDSPIVYDAAGLLGPLSLLSPTAARRAAQSDQAMRSALERAIELGLIPAADASSLGIDPPFSTEPAALDPALRAALAANPDLANRLFGNAADVNAGTIDFGADEVAALAAGVPDTEPLQQANPASNTVAAERSAATDRNDDGSAPNDAANATPANATSTDAAQAGTQQDSATATADSEQNLTAAQDLNNPMAPRTQTQTTETVTVRQPLPQPAATTQQAAVTPQVTSDPAYAGVASAFYLSALAAQMQANRPVTTGLDSPLAVAPARPVRRIEPAQPVASGRSAR